MDVGFELGVAAMTSWVVALEVDEDPNGPGIDAGAMARRMEAVADIRPAGGGGHSFLLRLDSQDSADALVAAVTRFRDAAGRGVALLGARVVRSGEAGQRAGQLAATRAAELVRPRVLAAVAAALLGGAALLALSAGTGGSGAATTRPTGVVNAPGNLLANPSFETPGPKPLGQARGVTAWGAVGVSTVSSPVHSGKRAEQVAVTTGQLGGLWLDAAAVGGQRYRQTAWLDVRELAPGARVEQILEWYGPTSNLLGYQTFPATATDSTFAERSQVATAPPGTVRARFLVNFTHGGTLVVDDADLRPA